jgi:hypothetical protein
LEHAGVLEFFGMRTGLAQRKRAHAGDGEAIVKKIMEVKKIPL